MTAAGRMKAADLKDRIAWGTPDPFAAIGEFLTPEWAGERKVDGCGALLELKAGRSRFGGLRSSSFPALAGIDIPGLAGTDLHGEFVAPALPGHPRALLNNSAALFASGPAQARKWLAYGPARFIAFDVTAVAGTDVTALPYDDRRALLTQVVARIQAAYPSCGVELVEQVPATAEAITAAITAGWEGVMLKLRTGRYTPSVRGQRSDNWRKVKRFNTVDCWLTGGVHDSRRHPGTAGSVELAVTGAGGATVVIGHAKIEELYRPHLTAGARVEVMAQGINPNGLLRHPHILCLRPDKTAADCGESQLSQLARV
jgi:hypothetical protein